MKILVALLLFVTLHANSTSLALYNFSNGHMESSFRHEEIVAIASVTKLFTAASVLESGVSIHEKVKVQGKTKGRFAQGAMVTRLELLKAMLIASDNLAADSLAYSHPGGYREFINHTNTFVGSIGLKNTKIFDASGLSVFNVSSANELVNFVWYLRHYPLITDISSRASDELEFDNNRRKTVKLQIKNTNPDLNKYNVLISKTGFTNAAGRCLVMLIQKGDDVLGVAVLGFENPKTRSEAVSQLINFK